MVSRSAPQRITHGRHCACSACERQDWTDPGLAPCGMHGADCPAFYQPWGNAGTYFDPGGYVERSQRDAPPAPALDDGGPTVAYRIFTNPESTILVRIWPGGHAELTTRPSSDATWRPPTWLQEQP